MIYYSWAFLNEQRAHWAHTTTLAYFLSALRWICRFELHEDSDSETFRFRKVNPNRGHEFKENSEVAHMCIAGTVHRSMRFTGTEEEVQRDARRRRGSLSVEQVEGMRSLDLRESRDQISSLAGTSSAKTPGTARSLKRLALIVIPFDLNFCFLWEQFSRWTRLNELKFSYWIERTRCQLFRTFCSLLLIIINLLINLNYAQQQFELRIMNLWRGFRWLLISSTLFYTQQDRFGSRFMRCPRSSKGNSKGWHKAAAVYWATSVAHTLFGTHVLNRFHKGSPESGCLPKKWSLAQKALCASFATSSAVLCIVTHNLHFIIEPACASPQFLVRTKLK